MISLFTLSCLLRISQLVRWAYPISFLHSDAYEIIRYPTRAEGGDGTASDLLIAIPDAFQPLWYWQSFISSAQFQSVALVSCEGVDLTSGV